MGTDFRKEIGTTIDQRGDEYTKISDAIWGFAEPRFQEYESTKLQQEFLKARGFSVKADLAGEETAFIAEWGSGKPILAFLGEFDALSSLQQEADCTERHPIEGKTNGHGCGHHLLGTASVAAVDALKTYMEENHMSGTIRYYGCPAEENAGGKAYLVRDGYFNDCDIAITWHPSTTNKTMGDDKFLANFRVFFTFHGISSHAAGAPELGRSALDAVEIMDIGVNYMREHMIDAARVHGAITNTGGIAPNVIPAEAQVLYAIRAPKVTQVKKLYERMCDIAKGAALITGTTVDIRQVAAYSNVIGNDVLEEVMDKNLDHFIPIGYTEEELAYAGKFKEVVTELDKEGLKDMIAHVVEKDKRKEVLDMPLLDFKLDRSESYGGGGSTDVGDVSWCIPTAQINTSTFPAQAPGHSWQNVSCGRTSIAHKNMLLAGKVIAATAIDLMEKPDVLQAAKDEFNKKMKRYGGYTCPVPQGAVPVIPGEKM